MNRMVDMGRRATMSSNDNIDEIKKLDNIHIQNAIKELEKKKI